MVAKPQATYNRIGIDTGGTFTDFAWFEDGELRVHKELSTADDPSTAILSGLERIAAAAESSLVHGSTVATNALLERRGARTALLTTAGFRDVLALGRQDRPSLYALVPRKEPALVPRNWRLEIDERISAQGEIIHALAPSELESIARVLHDERIESVAVCLLFSFLRPEHEQAVHDYLRGYGDDEWGRRLHISLSSAILPEFREYERTATTVINAYVAPIMSRYLKRLEEQVAPRPVVIMQSDGGIISAGVAGEQAARTVLSGPAGGVVGAFHVAQQCGIDQIITFDMGGTSTDVALCPGMLPATSHGEIAGMPLRLPILDIHTVGAGGGSLVDVDAGGALHVGPQSAGADPGPISYGRGRRGAGGDEKGIPDYYVTTTDANLVLGRLDADHFLGGEMRLDDVLAKTALTHLAQQIDAASAEAAAWDVVRVANATMERAIRRISVERGFDPRAFTLVAFGGAGPLHACDLAHALRIPRVLIPPAPGVLSALGMLVAEPSRNYSQTVLRCLAHDGDETWLGDVFAQLERKGLAAMRAEGYGEERLTYRRSLDVRYLGQAHELNVPFEPAKQGGIAEDFHAAHEQRYGYRPDSETVEVVTVRLTVLAPSTPPRLPRLHTADAGRPLPSSKARAVWFDGGMREAGVYERQGLPAGAYFEGPALIFQYDSTIVVPPHWRVDVHETGSLIINATSSAIEL